MYTIVKKKIEKLKHLLWLEKKEDDEFFTKRFQEFSLQKIEKSKEEGICFYPLSFNKKNQLKEGQITVIFNFSADIDYEHSFQPGSSVKIFQIDTEQGNIINFTDGLISLVRENKVEVTYYSQKSHLWMEHNVGIGIHLTFSQYTYTVMENAINAISVADGDRLANLRDIMLGSQKARYVKCKPFTNQWLNESQQTAVSHILSSLDVAVIHGPPGTGKTTTLVEAIIETLKTETQVLICAYNNIAVDILAERLMERDINVVRVGNPAKVTDELLKVTFDTQYYEHPYYIELLSSRKKIKNLEKELNKTKKRTLKRIKLKNELYQYKYYADTLELQIKSSIFRDCQVVAATMIGSSLKVLKHFTFSTVFIDEAAQALEPACWVPILKAKRVIFAGDHKQLPPTIKSHQAAQDGLMHTLFEKIIERKPECAKLLTKQYRMHEKIMNFSSKWFYNNKLIAADYVRNKTLINNDIPIEWINTSNNKSTEEREKDGTSIFNKKEVKLMLKIVSDYMIKIGEERIVQEKISFGIISPYSAQVKLLRQIIYADKTFFKFLSKKLITLKTIDGFQGQERDVIAISLVRSNHHSIIGFLADYRRINVAITRARKKLFIIGDYSTLKGDTFFDALYAYIKENGTINYNCFPKVKQLHTKKKVKNKNDKSVNLNDKNAYLDDKSVNLDDKSVDLNDKSVNLEEKNAYLEEKSVIQEDFSSSPKPDIPLPAKETDEISDTTNKEEKIEKNLTKTKEFFLIKFLRKIF